MDKKELCKLLCKMEKKVETARNKRGIKTIIAFALVYFLFIYLAEKPTGWNIAIDLIVSIIFAGIHFVINATIFNKLFKASEEEKKMLEGIRKRIRELD